MSIHNVGVIGAGARGRGFIRSLDRNRRGRVVAVADSHGPSLEKARESLPQGCAVYEDPTDVLAAAEVDLVYVATPGCTHADLAVAALGAGKAVLCEKPMGTTVEDCDRIVEAVQRTGRFFAVAMQNRYSHWARTTAELIHSGEIGQAKMMWCHEFRKPFASSKVGNWIVFHDTSGGPFVEMNAHHWDLFNGWAQAPATKVHALTQNTGAHAPGDIWDCGWANVEYANGIIASLGLSMITPHGHDLTMGVIGTHGWAKAVRTRDGASVRHYASNSPQERTYPAHLPAGQAASANADAESNMMDRLFDCIEEGAEPPTSCLWGREAVLVGIAAEMSAREGRAIPMEEVRSTSRFADLFPAYLTPKRGHEPPDRLG